MKKIAILLVAALAVASFNANAQGLSNILNNLKSGSSSSNESSSSTTNSIVNTITSVVDAVTGNSSTVSLPGTWTYTGVAISLESDSTLSNIAGSVASSSVESEIDSYLQKIGLTSGAMTFTFEEDGSFTCTFKKIPMSGTWETLEDGTKIKLQYSKVLKSLSMTGTLSATTTGCEMLFDGEKFLSFIQSALSYVSSQSSTASVVSSLADNYDNVLIGYKLKKTN